MPSSSITLTVVRLGCQDSIGVESSDNPSAPTDDTNIRSAGSSLVLVPSVGAFQTRGTPQHRAASTATVCLNFHFLKGPLALKTLLYFPLP